MLHKAGLEEPLRALVRQYLEAPDLNSTRRGMAAGRALSPLLGTLYLLPLDDAMQGLVAKNGIYYPRYMGDMVILAKTRWHLGTAIRELIRATLSLGLEPHQEKRFIGRIDNGFDFLGRRIHASDKLRPSAESLDRLATRARRLHEQGADHYRLRRCVRRWTSWLWGRLDAQVSRKGDLRRYLVFVLNQLQLSGVPLPRRWICPRSPTGGRSQHRWIAIRTRQRPLERACIAL